MSRFTHRHFLSCLLLITFSLVVFSQSGRKVQRAAPVPEPKPAPAPEAPPVPVAEVAANTDTIKLDTTLIPVPVSVTDRSGRYVPFLKKQHFTIYEDGLPQQIAHFSDDWVPFHVVLMLDTSDSDGERKRALLHAASEFIELLRPDDRVMVTTFDGNNKTLCDFTADRAVLRRAIEQAGKNRFWRFETSLNSTLHRLVTTNLAQIEGRKAVVIFTDGMDQGTFSCAPSREEAMRGPEAAEVRLPQRTFNLIEENGVVIYPVVHNFMAPGQRDLRAWPGTPPLIPGATGLPARISWLGNASRDDLRKLADTSAGRYFSADTVREVEEAFQSIAEDIGHQYTLGYYPTKQLLPGQFHHLSVRVNGEDVRVRARQSYRVPKKG